MHYLLDEQRIISSGFRCLEVLNNYRVLFIA